MNATPRSRMGIAFYCSANLSGLWMMFFASPMLCPVFGADENLCDNNYRDEAIADYEHRVDYSSLSTFHVLRESSAQTTNEVDIKPWYRGMRIFAGDDPLKQQVVNVGTVFETTTDVNGEPDKAGGLNAIVYGAPKYAVVGYVSAHQNYRDATNHCNADSQLANGIEPGMCQTDGIQEAILLNPSGGKANGIKGLIGASYVTKRIPRPRVIPNEGDGKTTLQIGYNGGTNNAKVEGGHLFCVRFYNAQTFLNLDVPLPPQPEDAHANAVNAVKADDITGFELLFEGDVAGRLIGDSSTGQLTNPFTLRQFDAEYIDRFDITRVLFHGGALEQPWNPPLYHFGVEILGAAREVGRNWLIRNERVAAAAVVNDIRSPEPNSLHVNIGAANESDESLFVDDYGYWICDDEVPLDQLNITMFDPRRIDTGCEGNAGFSRLDDFSKEYLPGESWTDVVDVPAGKYIVTYFQLTDSTGARSLHWNQYGKAIPEPRGQLLMAVGALLLCPRVAKNRGRQCVRGARRRRDKCKQVLHRTRRKWSAN